MCSITCTHIFSINLNLHRIQLPTTPIQGTSLACPIDMTSMAVARVSYIITSLLSVDDRGICFFRYLQPIFPHPKPLPTHTLLLHRQRQLEYDGQLVGLDWQPIATRLERMREDGDWLGQCS